jgi:WD40 repeat protein
MTFCDWFAGATQVKYNRQNPHILASAHDQYLYVWDTRMGAREVRKINAHSTKIYGIDWNRTRPTGIVTCALDKTVKFWDYEYAPDDTPERIIHTSSPVWRARHTPFGWGVLTMPQRRDTALYLWDRRAKPKQETIDEPVVKFEGHTDQVKEFLWRSRGGENPENGDDREFQLVTWGLDRDIRLWYVDKSILEKVGHDPKKMRFRVTRRGAKYLTFRDEATIVKQYKEALKEAEATKPTPRPMLAVDGARITSRGGQKDGFSNGQEKGILATGIQRQISQANLRGDNGSGRFERALIGVCEGGYMRARRKRQTEMNPITWMRGVKIARKVSQNNAGLNASKTSAHNGDFGFAWDIPENLGDEISFVGSKFPKIKFEKVNIAARTCTVSLTGPWGAGFQGIFVRADVSFPQDYPSDGKSIPEFMLEKTNSISYENITTIDAQLRRIALALVAKKRMCLEACLCYLLGERTDDAALVGSNDDGDSSTDDEAIVNSGRNVDEEEGISSLISNANQASVPLPKACGALWAPDGRLVCFFPPKEERIGKGLLSSLAVREGERAMRAPGGGRLWEGFGRLFMDSPIKRGRNDTDAEFDSSDSSYTSDESSDDDADIRSGPLGPGLGWRLQGGSTLSRRFRRGGSTDRSTQRSTGTGVKTTTTVTAKRRSIVAIHDMTHILPAKRELADQYVIGEGAQVCKHNAGVAEKYGYRDLADVWRLVEMVLCDDVPLEIYNSPKNRLGDWGETIMIMARRASLERGRRDSGLGLEFDEKEDNAPMSASESGFWGPVKWGGHPMGGQWLIEQLFGYFEKKADVQMLAMLSCILCEGDAGSGDDELHTGTVSIHISTG